MVVGFPKSGKEPVPPAKRNLKFVNPGLWTFFKKIWTTSSHRIWVVTYTLGGGFRYFFMFIPREMIHFDKHIFQMGCFNHQLVWGIPISRGFQAKASFANITGTWKCCWCRLGEHIVIYKKHQNNAGKKTRKPQLGKPNRNNVPILLMEEILHHLGWCQNLVNNGR